MKIGYVEQDKYVLGQRFNAAERRRHVVRSSVNCRIKHTTTLSPLSKPPIFEAPTSSRSPTLRRNPHSSSACFNSCLQT